MEKGRPGVVKFSGWRVVVFLSLLYTLHSTLHTVVYSAELMIQQHIKGLKDKKSEVRIASAKALGETGNTEAVPVLRDALKDKDDNVRMEVVYALSKIQDDAAVAALAVAVRDDEEKVRLAAVDGLSRSQNKSAISPLIDATNDKNKDIKKAAVILLGAIGDASVIQSLSRLLSDKNGDIRLTAVYAIGSIGGTDAIRALSVSLNDKENEISIAAVKILGALGDYDATPLLTAVLRQKRDPAIHRAVAEALVAIGDKSALPAIVKSLDNADDDNKKIFSEAIIKILEKNRKGSPKKKSAKAPVIIPDIPQQEQATVPAVSEVQPPSAGSTLSQEEKLKLMQQHYMEGVKLFQSRDYEKAAAEMEEVLKIDPEHAPSKDILKRIKEQEK